MAIMLFWSKLGLKWIEAALGVPDQTGSLDS